MPRKKVDCVATEDEWVDPIEATRIWRNCALQCINH